MHGIEVKIRMLFLRALIVGIGAVALLSAGSLGFLMWKSTATFQKMSGQSAEAVNRTLTGEMNAQAVRYADSCSEIIDQKLGRTEALLQMISGRVQKLYEEREQYPSVSYQNVKEISGEERAMQWMLPREMNPEEAAVKEEIGLLGNLKPDFEQSLAVNEQIQRVYFTSESGINVGYDSDYKKKPAYFEGRNREWYERAKEAGETVISEAYPDSFLNRMTVTFSMPCYDAHNNLLGVLAADLLIDDLVNMIGEIDLEFGGYAVLISNSGNVVAAPGMTTKNSRKTELFLGSNSRKILQAVQKQMKDVCESRIDGEEKYVVTASTDRAGWGMILILDREEFRQTAKESTVLLNETAEKTAKNMKRQMLFVGVVWCVTAGGIWAAVRGRIKRLAEDISKPLVKLTADARLIGEGNLSYIPDIHTGDEVEELSTAFAKMTRSLKQYIENLSAMCAEKERLATELHVATQIQTSMLPCIFPAFPEREELDIYASMNPAKEVGGDFYDFFLADENRLCVVIADVSGKGIPAALFMVVAKTLLKDNLLQGRTLKEAMERVNHQLCENNEAGMFVTVFAAVLNLSDGKMEYVNAGHNPPVRIENGDASAGEKPRIGWLKKPSGFVMAVMEEQNYEVGTVQLNPGDIYFAYTDGVTEAQNPDGELYGEERLYEALGTGTGQGFTAQDYVNDVADKVAAFAGEAVQTDDITMLALIYRPASCSRAKREFRAVKETLPELTAFLDEMIRRTGITADRTAADQTTTDRTAADQTTTHRTKADCIKKEHGFWIRLAAEEIFTNIASYAYGKNTEPQMRTVSVEFEFLKAGKEETKETKENFPKSKICVTFRDRGIPYNPLERKKPNLKLKAEERPVGGMGIHIVRESMDETNYKYENGENVLSFAKYV